MFLGLQKIQIKYAFGLGVIFFVGLVVGGVIVKKNIITHFLSGNNEVVVDERIAFVDEVYQLIKTEYWQLLLDDQLATIFQKAIEKISGEKIVLSTSDLSGVKTAFQEILVKQENEDKKNSLVSDVMNVVLINLQPFGRSRLLSQKDSQAILDSVTSRNPKENYFETLGVEATASAQVISKSFRQKQQEIARSQVSSEEKKQAQQNLQRAYQALDSQAERSRYAQTGIESSLSSKNISQDVYYLRLKSFAPTTYEDIALALQAVPPQKKQTSLIIDLRGNPGGYIDGLPNVLGAFYGPGVKAYQMLKQGQKTDLETKTNKLSGLDQFKKRIILIDQTTGSSAEAMAASLKKYHFGVLVGVPSRGWGTMERLFSIKHQFVPEQTFSILLVQNLTLREDGIPIEGSGITPDVNISDPGWQRELLAYFSSPSLVAVVRKMVEQ